MGGRGKEEGREGGREERKKRVMWWSEVSVKCLPQLLSVDFPEAGSLPEP